MSVFLLACVRVFLSCICLMHFLFDGWRMSFEVRLVVFIICFDVLSSCFKFVGV